VEQFSLSEMLQKKFNIVQGKRYIDIYSTSGKKRYAKKVISHFFSVYEGERVSSLSNRSKKVSLKRPFSVIMRQKLTKRV